MALKDQLFISGVWTDSSVQGENTTGTPIVSAALDGTGEEISDLYTLTVSARSGGTGTVTVAASANNPFNGRVKTGVNFDDTTEYNNIVPGVAIIFDNAGVNGDAAEITIGSPYGAFDASGVGAGVPTAGVRHRVLNDGTSNVTDSKARLLTQAIQVLITNRVFAFINPFADGATEKTAGGGSDRIMPYAMTISAVSGSGMSKVATLSVDGVAFAADTLLDLTTGLTHSGVGIKAIGSSYPYQVVDGPLEGLVFALDAGVANSDEANVLIFPSRYVQIAKDVAGVEGTYGTSDVDLTEAGQATGVITPSGVAYYWTRFLVPAASNNESNPYPTNVALSASLSTAAGWEE
jgi:hypothetical protein